MLLPLSVLLLGDVEPYFEEFPNSQSQELLPPCKSGLSPLALTVVVPVKYCQPCCVCHRRHYVVNVTPWLSSLPPDSRQGTSVQRSPLLSLSPLALSTKTPIRVARL